MKRFIFGAFGLGILGATTLLQAEESLFVTVRNLTAPVAAKMALAAYEECTAKGYHVAAAVVSREGRLLAMVRSPLAGPHTIEVSERKAFTATTFRTPTSRLMGRDFMRDIPQALIFGGGMPINIGGHFYGGIGVSGAPEKAKPGDVDDECALAGINAVSEDLEMADD